MSCECGCGRPTPIAKRSDRRTGAIRDQPQRFVKGHSTRIEGERFVREDRGYKTPCLIWQGATAGAGYGIRDRDGRREYVHRLAWEAANGLIPPGLNVLHRCDVPACAEPTHLFLGTQLDNVADAREKGRMVRPPVLCGPANGNWKHGRRAKAA